MDRGVWWATVQGAAESDMTEPLSTHAPMQGNSVCAIDISSDARNFHLSTPTKVKVKSLSRVRLFATPWTVAYLAPLFVGFSRHSTIVLKWIAISFSRGSSQPRDQSRVTHIVDRHFTVWATREVQC